MPSILSDRCDPADITRLLSPGMVTGLFHGNQWIDWSASIPDDMALLSAAEKPHWGRIDRDRFQVLVDPAGGASMGPLLECLAGVTPGVAVISVRLGTLLRWCPRIVAPPLYPQRTSGPFRARTSGAVLLVREMSLRIFERAQVQDSAALTLTLEDPGRAVPILEPVFPDLRVEGHLLHLGLRGQTAEEVLGRLRFEGVKVKGSTVWYRLVQSAPRPGVSNPSTYLGP